MSDFDKYLLVPQYSDLYSREEVNLESPFLGLALPFIASPMSSVCEAPMANAIANLGGVGVIHRYMSAEEQANQVRLVHGPGHRVGASISSKVDDRGQRLIEAGADFLVLDVAHGDSMSAYDAVAFWARQIPVVSGNIVTSDAALRYENSGASALRVGIGTGSACTTREVAGVGRNQIDAIQVIAGGTKLPILSCGGIRNSGDIVKALAAGADAVIIGGLFAGCDVAPSMGDYLGGAHAGMASWEAEDERVKRTGEDRASLIHLMVPEGRVVTAKGSGEKLEDIVARLAGGVKIGFSYLGARNIREAHANARFVLA